MPPKARRLSIDGGGRCGTLEQAGSPVLSPSFRTATGPEGHRIDASVRRKQMGHTALNCAAHNADAVSN